MAIHLLFVVIGIAGLYYGGDYLVKGSVALSLRYGIPPLIVGLTVMAFGTSAPELFVSLRAALSGFGDIAFGNVVGSNIANILLILGVPAVIYPLRTDKVDCRIPWTEAMVASLLLWWLVQYSPFTRWQGLVLLAVFAAVMTGQFIRARSGSEEVAPEVDESHKNDKVLFIILWLIIGFVLLPLGGELLVRGAVGIARQFGLSDAIIGLTIVAIGTSLPELAASIAAAERGETSMAVGNALGSCIFNILLVLGVTGVLTSSIIDASLIRFDIPVMILALGFMAIFVFMRRPISRFAGIVMLFSYGAYLLRLVL